MERFNKTETAIVLANVVKCSIQWDVNGRTEKRDDEKSLEH